MIGALAIDRSQGKAKDGCDNSELVFAEAWSPAVRSELARTPGVQPQAFLRVADALDQFRERWMASYDKTCRARSSPGFRPRIACLEGMRDQVSAFAYLLRDPRVYQGFDPWAVLPSLAVCESASPNTPAALPTEQPRRSQVLQAVARSFALNGVPPAELDVAVNTLITDVKAIKWQPLMPIVLVAAGAAYCATRATCAPAKSTSRRSRASPRTGATTPASKPRRGSASSKLETRARESRARAYHRGITDPSAKPVLHDELARLLASVTSSVGSNPMMLGARASLAALAYAELGQYNRYKHAYEEALDYVNEARKHFESIGDIRRAAGNSRLEALIISRAATTARSTKRCSRRGAPPMHSRRPNCRHYPPSTRSSR